MQFNIISDFQPTGDQPTAIKQLVEGVNADLPAQTLLGVTGSGKTFTIANVIMQTQKPTLILSHNKTLAAKAALACLTECLAEEFKDLNISFNCLALGAVQTEMLEEAFPGYKAPLTAWEMAEFISKFSVNANKVMNGKIIPVSLSTP